MKLYEITNILEKLGIDDYSIKIHQKELYVHKERDYEVLKLTRYVVNRDGELYIGDYKIINKKIEISDESYFGEEEE